MSRSRVLSRRHLVPGGLLAGLALTGSALSLGSAHHSHSSVQAPAVAQAVALPSVLTTPAPPRRASRGAARTALAPVRYIHRDVAVGRSFSGYASWYGGSFQGRRTASGERFDTYELTAASRTLPFGTRLRVCRRSTCVVVRVNDRGPYVGSRVLDLSRAARDRLGYFGVAQVTATPVTSRRVALPAAAPPATPPHLTPPVHLTAAPVLAAQSDSTSSRRGGADCRLGAGLFLVGSSCLVWLRRRRVP
jgi:rare lipoprotein A